MGLIKKLRQINRKRNHLKKELKYNFKLYMESRKWSGELAKSISPEQIKSILLVRNEGKIGDAIVSTCFLSNLYEAGYSVDVLAVRGNEIIFKNNPHIRNVYLSDEINVSITDGKGNHCIPLDTLTILKENEYDLLIDTAVWQTGLYMPKMIYDIQPRATIGFNKPKWMTQYQFNLPFDYQTTHIKNIYLSISKFLKADNSHTGYEIFYPKSIDKDVLNTGFFTHSSETILINIYASHSDRNLSELQLTDLIQRLLTLNSDTNIVVIDHLKRLKSEDFQGVNIYQVPSIHHAMAAVKMCDLVISPDTAIVHIAATFNTKLIGIYQDLVKNNELWSPGYDNGHQVFSNEYVIKKDALIVEKIINKKMELTALNT